MYSFYWVEPTKNVPVWAGRAEPLTFIEVSTHEKVNYKMKTLIIIKKLTMRIHITEPDLHTSNKREDLGIKE